MEWGYECMKVLWEYFVMPPIKRGHFIEQFSKIVGTQSSLDYFCDPLLFMNIFCDPPPSFQDPLFEVNEIPLHSICNLPTSVTGLPGTKLL